MNPFAPRETVIATALFVVLVIVPISVFMPLYVFFTNVDNGIPLLVLGAWPPIAFAMPLAQVFFRRTMLARWNQYQFRYVAVDTVAYNQDRIVRVPCLNRWVWRPTVLWSMLAVVVVVIPLCVLLPLGLQTRLDLAYTSNPEPAMWFFSLVFPVLYVLAVAHAHRRRATAKMLATPISVPTAVATPSSATDKPLATRLARNADNDNDDGAMDQGLIELQLGSTMYVAWRFIDNHAAQLLHALALWALVVIPLACGLSKCIYNQVHGTWPPSTVVPNASVKWTLCFFGIVLPCVYVLALACTWMMPLRVVVYGQVEADSDESSFKEAVALANRMRWPRGSELQYPYWSMGEVLVTTGVKRRLYRGRKLSVGRAFVAFFVLGVLPVVVLVPVIYTDALTVGSTSNAVSTWQGAVVLFVVVACPLVTSTVVIVKLVHDACSEAARAAAPTLALWTALCFIVPLAGCIPGLVFSPSPTVTSVLCALLVFGPALFVAMLAATAREQWSHVSRWLRRLTLNGASVRRVLSLSVRIGLPVVVLCPLVSLALVVAALLAPAAFGSPDELSISVATLQLASGLVFTVVVEGAVALGWSRPSLRAMSSLPWVCIVTAILVAAVLIAEAARTARDDAFQMRGIFQAVLALVVIQCAAGAALGGVVVKSRLEHERFGYFPEPWELEAPTSRFVVAEATHVVHMSDEALSSELVRRHLAHVVGDRHQMERLLEQDIAQACAKEAALERREAERARQQRRRYQASQLAHTVFMEIFSKGVARRANDAVSFEVGKMFGSLARASRRKLAPTTRATHVIEVSDDELRLCNIVFGDFRAISFASIEYVTWITSESAALLDLPWSALRLLEFKAEKKRPRVVVFFNAEARDDFLRALTNAIAKTTAAEFLYQDGKLSRVPRSLLVLEADV